jgi:hypothetical protein
MKTIITAAILSIFLVLCGTGSAMAQGPKPWIFSWWPSHWEDLNFEKPYLEPGKEPHNSQWSHIDWAPQDWLNQYDHELTLISDFYRAEIITDQYVRRAWFGLGKEIIPVLEVGPAFYRLGGQDKRRVTDTFDEVYGITGSKMFGMFVLEDSITGRQVGTYSQYGLAIQ